MKLKEICRYLRDEDRNNVEAVYLEPSEIDKYSNADSSKGDSGRLIIFVFMSNAKTQQLHFFRTETNFNLK